MNENLMEMLAECIDRLKRCTAEVATLRAELERFNGSLKDDPGGSGVSMQSGSRG